MHLRPWRTHSLVLAVLGTIYALIGLSYIAAPLTPGRASALRVGLQWMPIDGWGIVFIIVGALGILSSRWPPASETWGYTAFSGLSTLWGLFYALGIPYGSAASNVTAALLWLGVAFLWWGISRLKNG